MNKSVLKKILSLIFRYFKRQKKWIFLLAYLIYYRHKSQHKLHYYKNAKNEQIVRNAKLNDGYSPSLILPPIGHLQTVVPEFLKKKNIDVQYDLEVLVLEDGTEICLAWHQVETAFGIDTPTCVIMHGLSGSHDSYYVKYLAQYLYRVYGWRCVVFNARGSAGFNLKSPSVFHAGFTDDIEIVSKHVRSKLPHAPMVAIGYSLGANILTNYLGKCGEHVPYSAAVAISNPCNLPETNRQMDQFLQRNTYARFLVQGLKDYFVNNQDVLLKLDGVDREEVLSSSTVYEFDRQIIIKSAGYKTVEEYYSDASSSKRMHLIKIPLLTISAEDDPISSYKGIPVHLAETHPNLFFLLTKSGGHMGWTHGFNLRHNNSYADIISGNFLQEILSKK